MTKPERVDVLILGAPPALEQRLGAAAPADTVFPHPMLSEGINKAARGFRR